MKPAPAALVLLTGLTMLVAACARALTTYPVAVGALLVVGTIAVGSSVRAPIASVLAAHAAMVAVLVAEPTGLEAALSGLAGVVHIAAAHTWRRPWLHSTALRALVPAAVVGAAVAMAATAVRVDAPWLLLLAPFAIIVAYAVAVSAVAART